MVSRFTDAKCDKCIMVACLGSLEIYQRSFSFFFMMNYVWLCALQLLHSAIYVYVN
jgi:hypothetical protein